MNEEAKKWIGKKVRNEIIGLCCNISNNCAHTYPIKRFTDSRFGSHIKTNNDIDRDLDKMKFLISNFGEFIDINNIVDDHFSIKANQNQWSSERNQEIFKLYINDALQLVRDEKLIEVGI